MYVYLYIDGILFKITFFNYLLLVYGNVTDRYILIL